MVPPPSATLTGTVTETSWSTPDSAKSIDVKDLPIEKGTVPRAVQEGLDAFPQPPKFEDKLEEREYLKGRLAMACRLFGKLGMDEGAAGHITLRDPILPEHFWVNPFGLSFSLMKRSDLILVNEEGKVVDGGPRRLLNTAAYSIHASIHKARPDVMCAAHSHSVYGRAFCALGKPLDAITQDSCAFYQNHSIYSSFNGVVLAKEEGELIAKLLGDNKAILLQNHGLLTAGQTVEACVYWFHALDRACQIQLLADAAAAGTGGATKKISHEDAVYTYSAVGTPYAGWFQGMTLFDVLAYQGNEDYLD